MLHLLFLGKARKNYAMLEIQIRDARLDDCPALGHVLVSAMRDAFRGRVPDHCLEWLTPEVSATNWARNFEPGGSLERGSCLLVAETAAAEVVGLALLGDMRVETLSDPQLATRFPRELLTIHVDPQWQRMGVGRQLVASVTQVLRQEGTRRLLVRVLFENPNRAFYERLGAVRLGTAPYDWEGYLTEEILYGWDDVDRLFGRVQ